MQPVQIGSMSPAELIEWCIKLNQPLSENVGNRPYVEVLLFRQKEVDLTLINVQRRIRKLRSGPTLELLENLEKQLKDLKSKLAAEKVLVVSEWNKMDPEQLESIVRELIRPIDFMLPYTPFTLIKSRREAIVLFKHELTRWRHYPDRDIHQLDIWIKSLETLDKELAKLQLTYPPTEE